MSAKQKGKSNAVAWTLTIVAVPVLYVLSVPPIGLGYARLTGLGDDEEPPRWLTAYATPYAWLVDRTPWEMHWMTTRHGG